MFHPFLSWGKKATVATAPRITKKTKPCPATMVFPMFGLYYFFLSCLQSYFCSQFPQAHNSEAIGVIGIGGDMHAFIITLFYFFTFFSFCTCDGKAAHHFSALTRELLHYLSDFLHACCTAEK
ncbi:hypothetical protein BC940DRAFT_35263 [Gongronella butleri]|nr:hypothetical protein BC940DRAFT_35263 [Gongronella butleri]